MSDITCASCGVVFGMPDHLESELRRTHKSFYCPNGHSIHFAGKTKEEKRIDELERELRDERTAAHNRFRDLLERKWALDELATHCPLCGDRTGRSNYRDETNRAKLIAHLEDEHAARRRLRAIPAKASEGNA